MNVRRSMLALCLLGMSTLGSVAFATPASATTAVCQEGHSCPAEPIECPYGWGLNWGTFSFEWKQEAYCLDPRAVVTPERQAQRDRGYADV
ncbi:hypothetical protein [Rhodococcus sp. NPDC058521]|uniref:hypothetical protein n=1 Tax=Rhodococcus sp. NPDC058521 TaxID=3346536 RepID=UPI00366486A8